MRCFLTGLLGCLALVAVPLAAQQAHLDDLISQREAASLLEIGGVGGPSWLQDTRDPGHLRAGAAGPACGGLDVREGTRQFLEQVSAGREPLRAQAYSAATGAVSALPWLTLRRALPEVADLFDGALARAENKMQQLAARCNDDRRAAQSADGSGEGWRAVARAEGWNAAGRKALTPAQGERAAGEAATGVRWLGGQVRGGKGQTPIRVLADTATASAQLLFERMGRQLPWQSPAQASAWLVRVLGDAEIGEGAQVLHNKVGGGLWLEVLTEQQRLAPLLAEVLAQSRRGEAPGQALAELGASRHGLQPHLLNQLSRSSPAWRRQVLTRLAYELALANILDQALLGRQLLALALEMPEVMALAPAKEQLRERLQRLDRGLESMLFEYRARQSMGETLKRIWNAAQTGGGSDSGGGNR